MKLTASDYARAILFGLLTMIMGLIVTVVILVTVLMIIQREMPVGPVYLLVPISTFSAGCYWSIRQASRPKAPAKPPSRIAIIAKSTAAGIAVVVLCLIAYVAAMWFVYARETHASIGIDVHRVTYWPVILAIFLAGFLFEYRRASRHPSL